jgi:hypothetical protein
MELDIGGLTACFAKAVLADSAGANTNYSTTTAFNYALQGAAQLKAIISATTVPTTDGNTGAAFVALQPSRRCTFVFGVNAAGTVTVYQGGITTVDASNLPVTMGQLPQIPATVCPFGMITYQTTSASSAWTFGSSNFNATGVTRLATNLSTYPSRPDSGVTA